MNTKAKAAKLIEIHGIQVEANSAKSQLIKLRSLMDNVSKRHAMALSKIIWKLEAWQNKA